MMEDIMLFAPALENYQAIFALSAADLSKKIVDCAAGFAAFNAEMHDLKHKVVSVDKIYNLNPADMQACLKIKMAAMLESTHHRQHFNWHGIVTPEDFMQQTEKNAQRFLDDYSLAFENENRYVAGDVIQLDFENNQFDLALCSHLLFADSRLDQQSHLQAIREMARVAAELRVFPLLNAKGQASHMLGPIMLALQQENYGVAVHDVSDELQKSGHAMLVVTAKECKV